MTTDNGHQNPFMTPFVYGAGNKARVYYLETLATLQQFGGSSIDELQEAASKHRDKLDLYREEALKASRLGDIQAASVQLAYIVMEWGLYKAHTDLINAGGAYLDPADPDTVTAFVRVLEHSIAYWATELQNARTEAEQARKADLASSYMDHNEQLFQFYQRFYLNQGDALNQAHQYNKHYADAALRGAQQAQQGAQWMMDGVKELNRQAGEQNQWVHQGVQHMYSQVQQSMQENLRAQKAATENIVQNLPREMGKEQFKAQTRGCAMGCLSRGILAVLLIASIPAAIGIAYILLTHVVLH